MLSKQYDAVFVWSTSTGQWTQSIPLSGSPNGMAYDNALNRLYLFYADNRITAESPSGGPRPS